MKKKTSPRLTRASVAEITGINPETLRYYEREGLIRAPERSAAGYRIYGEEDLKRLRFIERSKGLGFSLRDIREFIALTSDPKTPRKELRAFADAQLRLIRKKIRDLKAMEKTLAGLVSECDGEGEVEGCPIAEFASEGKDLTTKGKRNHE